MICGVHKSRLGDARLARGSPRWQVSGCGLTKPRFLWDFALMGQASATINVATDLRTRDLLDLNEDHYYGTLALV